MALTRNITAPERPLLALLVAATFGAALAASAWPRLEAALAEVPARPLLERLARDEAVPPEELRAASEALTRALAVRPSAAAWSALGWVELNRALARSDPATLEASLAAHRAALKRNPALVYAWLRVAEAEALAHGPSTEAARALAAALALTPYFYDLFWPRLDLGLLLWRDLDAGARAKLAEQIRYGAQMNVWTLAGHARRRHALAPVRAALAAEPALQAQLERLYRAGASR